MIRRMTVKLISYEQHLMVEVTSILRRSTTSDPSCQRRLLFWSATFICGSSMARILLAASVGNSDVFQATSDGCNLQCKFFCGEKCTSHVEEYHVCSMLMMIYWFSLWECIIRNLHVFLALPLLLNSTAPCGNGASRFGTNGYAREVSERWKL